MNEQAIIPMNEALAEEIAEWRYPGEYAVYNRASEDSLDGLLDGRTYAVLNTEGTAIGFYQFGEGAKIPTQEEDVYQEGSLDMGLGLRPDLCGLRLGQPFVQAGMKFARETFGAKSFRLTVADFNRRARKVYAYCGFFSIRNVTHRDSGDKFIVMRTEDLSYKNSISTEDYCRLRAAVGFSAVCPEQAGAGLKGSAYTVGCYDRDVAVGSARLIWDGGYTAYLADVMVLPEYQRLGIGTRLVERCMMFLRMQLQPGWRFKVNLLAGQGEEGFCERFGFDPCPNETAGPGMVMWME